MMQRYADALAIHPWALRLFSALWSHRLRHEGCAGKPARVIRLKGWRTALIESSDGQRATVTWL